jgi:hypothetical protein
VSFALSIALQLTVTAAPSPMTDDALAMLAARENPVTSWATGAIINDAEMRAEIRRVGFVNGCNAMADSRAEISRRYNDEIIPITVAAIRAVVPEDRMNEVTILSFMFGPLQIYKGRIWDRLDQNAAALRNEITGDMRALFLANTSPLPTNKDPNANLILPKPDIAKALGIVGPYDLDKPASIGLACAEQRISPEQRPMISTEE